MQAFSPSMCGADAGALLIDVKLTSQVVALLKEAHWYPEAYREPPARRTRVLCVDFLCGRFGNPDVVASLRIKAAKSEGIGRSAEQIPITR
jgi:hypothetical protein